MPGVTLKFRFVRDAHEVGLEICRRNGIVTTQDSRECGGPRLPQVRNSFCWCHTSEPLSDSSVHQLETQAERRP